PHPPTTRHAQLIAAGQGLSAAASASVAASTARRRRSQRPASMNGLFFSASFLSGPTRALVPVLTDTSD
ncbi:hypothetical protein PV379_10150, partial [Streptomyces caniscabiei]|uniref:hypothetical protein n=1 Tax=Streptomyces caniscabiei TaxID=2746961 RepID=UPI0029A8E253